MVKSNGSWDHQTDFGELRFPSVTRSQYFPKSSVAMMILGALFTLSFLFSLMVASGLVTVDLLAGIAMLAFVSVYSRAHKLIRKFQGEDSKLKNEAPRGVSSAKLSTATKKAGVLSKQLLSVR
ncbi:expressed unknown protein [Seminavis robusta]|uniref:Uncharacterized protein n=1 Tax=Seminavis robusta TaxID=568900 RepID=A0A9N8HFU1_9STRA|nr:expressed unknown protein [Seminavis robusta]|eukprot:Sro365_g127350.1 n/a (123) ;mRNA; f:27507-28186